MRLVIQCAGKKDESAGRLKNASGVRVVFVAHPEKCTQTEAYLRYYRPDDEVGTELGTWREYPDSLQPARPKP